MSSDDIPTLAEIQRDYGQLATFKELFYDWNGANTWLFKAINGHLHGDAYDAFMMLITRLGDHKFFLFYLGALAVFAVMEAIWRKLRRKAAVRQHLIMWLGVFIVLGVGALVNHLLIDILKDYFSFPRPYVVLPPAEMVLLEIRSPESALRSFPSGHTAFISMVVAGLWPVMSSHFRKFGLFLIFMVGWSRVALGVHFPADAVWGFLISSLVIIAVRAAVYSLLLKMFRMKCGGG